MIVLDAAQAALVDGLLASRTVDARLVLRSILGGETLAVLAPSAGSIRWDSSDRRGVLDVDVSVEDAVLHPRHPLANLGQVLEASWEWPQIGVSVPCGRWLVSEPSSREGRLWQVSADPEGPARLARARTWEPSGRVVSGPLGDQVGGLLGTVGIPWTPAGPWSEWSVPDTQCAPGVPVLDSVQRVIDAVDVELRPARRGRGVELLRRTGGTPVWSWSTSTPTVASIVGTPSPEDVPNRVTVWCEEDVDGVRTVRGWSEPLFSGPRRWGGPYGQVPLVVKLDAPASVAAMAQQARSMLAHLQSSAATVRVEMVADPRVELGDVAAVSNPDEGTNCTARVTSVSLDAASGRGVVECSVLSGLVAGVPAAMIES